MTSFNREKAAPLAIAVSASVLAAVTAAAFLVGSSSVSLGDLVAWATGGDVSASAKSILVNVRLPRVLAALLAGGALAVFVTMSVYKMDFDHLTYQIALPLMAAGFLFLPMHEPWNVIGTAVHQFGYQYFYIVLWALWPVLASRDSVPTGWVVSRGLLCIQLGQFVGSVAAAIALTFVQSDLGLAMVSAGVIFVILIIALFAMGSGSANTGWGFVKPMEEADAASDFEKAGTRLARRCRLSPREIEVFFLLAKGRNRAYIREELVIGDETVKSHIKSIYRKADVHSQQELIDLLERESSAGEPRGRG